MRIFAGRRDPFICENVAEDVCFDLIDFTQRKRAEALAVAA